jgi:hypothetical protein
VSLLGFWPAAFLAVLSRGSGLGFARATLVRFATFATQGNSVRVFAWHLPRLYWNRVHVSIHGIFERQQPVIFSRRQFEAVEAFLHYAPVGAGIDSSPATLHEHHCWCLGRVEPQVEPSEQAARASHRSTPKSFHGFAVVNHLGVLGAEMLKGWMLVITIHRTAALRLGLIGQLYGGGATVPRVSITPGPFRHTQDITLTALGCQA